MAETDDTREVACELTPEIAAEQTRNVTDGFADAFSHAEKREDGHTVVFEGTEETLETVAAFVANEHQCCAFADYEIAVAPPYEETRLTITGPEGTKELFGQSFVDLLRTASA
ncbi:Zn-dependent oxidoreductase [Halobacteriales archaeon Cl-PHB]